MLDSFAVIGAPMPTEKEHGTIRTPLDDRRHPRFKLEVDIGIYSRTCGMLKGRTVNISESGIATLLTLEVPLGDIVELNLTLPSGSLTTRAIVRQRNAFRYGFEFFDSYSVGEVIRRACRDLAIEQHLISRKRDGERT
jgi:hypothetical protein